MGERKQESAAVSSCGCRLRRTCVSPHSFDTAHGSQKALVENYRPTLPSAVFGATRVKEGKVRRSMEKKT